MTDLVMPDQQLRAVAVWWQFKASVNVLHQHVLFSLIKSFHRRINITRLVRHQYFHYRLYCPVLSTDTRHQRDLLHVQMITGLVLTITVLLCSLQPAACMQSAARVPRDLLAYWAHAHCPYSTQSHYYYIHVASKWNAPDENMLYRGNSEIT